MTQQELEQIPYFDNEIKMWEQELEQRKNMSFVASPLPQVGSCSGISDKVADRACTDADIKQKIEETKTKITHLRNAAIFFILTIPDSQTRMIIYYRCVMCMSWKRVAYEIGGGNTEDSVRKIYSRFFGEK